MSEQTCHIDDRGPFPVQRPGSVAELGEQVVRARDNDHAVFPLGGRTSLGIGLPPGRGGVCLDLRSLDRVIDYPARDMTITVQAGLTVGRLQELLAAENQRLPVDVPRADSATVGGVLAANVSGPRRHGAGTLRDYVIGISTVNDEGQETKAGGRVVKNVAGYDLCKLHVGALGTLGIIAQVTFKVRPRPEGQALVAIGCDSDKLSALLDQLHATQTRPMCLDLLNAEAVNAIHSRPPGQGLSLPGTAWVVVVGFEDSEAAVRWQVQQLLREVGSLGAGSFTLAGASSEPLWQALTEFLSPPGVRLSFKANLLPGRVADFCLNASAHAGLQLHAQAGSGIVHGHLGDGLTESAVAAMLEGLLKRALEAHGNLVLPRCPVEWKRTLPVWGRPRGDSWLMRQVKLKLDPGSLFNPGRFIEGI